MDAVRRVAEEAGRIGDVAAAEDEAVRIAQREEVEAVRRRVDHRIAGIGHRVGRGRASGGSEASGERRVGQRQRRVGDAGVGGAGVGGRRRRWRRSGARRPPRWRRRRAAHRDYPGWSWNWPPQAATEISATKPTI
jgi:hypothetical protein